MCVVYGSASGINALSILAISGISRGNLKRSYMRWFGSVTVTSATDTCFFGVQLWLEQLKTLVLTY